MGGGRQFHYWPKGSMKGKAGPVSVGLKDKWNFRACDA